ncbi:hypothetical protein BGZ74_008207 [Mortierella antarctica]|nr:hypothetical protein BGZ74_008207 [Mortierella antarctica]
MAYYNNNATSPRQGFASPPIAPRSTKPVNYISSPFDDDPVPSPAASSYQPSYNNNQYEKNDPYTNPYNPDYMTSSQRSNSYNQSQHSTQEHSLSPGQSEKHLATGAGAGAAGEAYAMQHLSAAHDGGQRGYDNYQGNPSHNNNMNKDSYSNNHNYYNGYDEDRPSLSNDTAPMRPLSDQETSDGIARSKTGVSRVKYDTREKSKYLPCFPCIRSTCGRFTCCICLFLLLVIIALAIVIFTVFKLPTVNYKGTDGEPQFLINQGSTTFGVNITAIIEVVNPNPIGFHFESIVATAYYPVAGYTKSIGGGQVTNADFPKKSSTQLKFPIAASYNRADDKGLVVIADILSRCGQTGGQESRLTINYDLKLTIKIIGISISPTIKNQHSDFACPPNINDIASGLTLG